jgi:hypothetical protein
MSMLGQQTISAGSVHNGELEGAGWACEFDCAGPVAFIQPPGLLEIKAETLRATICSTTDLLQDASFNIEGWTQRKAARAMRQKLAMAFISGDGLGKPLGILNKTAGIPICTVAAPAIKQTIPVALPKLLGITANPFTCRSIDAVHHALARRSPANQRRTGWN